ncbi:MAG: MBL fold metallo-hydrolase [Syntrophorhabdales bacterium]|jgi:glyoxylase-like metal-dependent hydrolase (beta-lactamase superfamily II)
MRVFKDLYFYPWLSMQENNANTVFIDGAVPTLIDPGHAHLFTHVEAAMAHDGLDMGRIKVILFTHGHPDHIEATDLFDEKVLRGIGKKEYTYMQQEGKELFLASGTQMPARPFTLFLNEGRLTLGDKTLLVIPTPGHSPGSICLYLEKEKVLLSGDTVFYLGVGRTDLPGGDVDQLAYSIRMLSKLDVEYLVPGHGEMLKGRKAIQKNFEMILSEFFE